MYICKDCNKRFLTPRVYFEPRGEAGPPYERFLICPNCSSDNFEPMEIKYCKCCGKRLPENKKDYCNNRCRVNGQKLFIKELRKRRALQSDPIFETVLAAEEYNKQNGTSYSYGQYVAKVLKNGI